MAAEHPGIRVEYQELAPYGMEEEFVISGKQVCAAYAPVEQDIAGEKHVHGGDMQTDAALGMARGIEYVNGPSFHMQHFPIVEKEVGMFRLFHFETEDCGMFRAAVEERNASCMGPVLCAIGLPYMLVAKDMVDMGMGIDDGAGLETVATDQVVERLLFHIGMHSRVDHPGIAIGAGQDIGVDLKRVEAKLKQAHGRSFWQT